MFREEEMKIEIGREIDLIQDIDIQFKRRKEVVEKLLSLAKLKLQEVLVQWAIGEVPRATVDEVKTKIRKYEDELSEFPMIKSGLEKREAQARSRMREILNRISYRPKYEELKNQMLESPHGLEDTDFLKTIRGYAQALEDPEDFRSFVNEMESREDQPPNLK